MKTFLIICTLLLCVIVATGQQKSNLNVVYDKIEDRTSVSTPVKGVKGSSLKVLGYFNHPGETPPKPTEKVGLVFYSWANEWKYLTERDRRLFVLAGDRRFSFDSARIGSVNPRVGPHSRVSVTEQLIFRVTVDELDQILGAVQIQMKIRDAIFTFDGETVAALRELSARARLP